METVTLAYTESLVEYTRSFSLLSFKGFSDVDAIDLVAVGHKHLDGSRSETIRGFRRVLSLDFGVLQDFEDRKFIADFIRNSNRQVRQSGDFAAGVLLDFDRFINEWKDELEIGRRFYLELTDPYVYTQWPVASVTEELMYFKAKVQITGTPDSPQTLTTGSSPLATMETGAAWPTFNASTHKVHVSVDGAPYNEARIYITTQPSISGGNVTLLVAVGYGGNASGDGNYYADIAVFLQEII